MAKQLYDYWFVQFDFPDANARPYKSSGGQMVWNEKLKREIPAGWKVGSLADMLDYAGGSQPPASEFIFQPKQGYVRFVQIRDYYTDAHITYIPISSRNKICNENDIMIARYGASLGRICYGLNGAYNVALAKITPKKDFYREYLRTLLASEAFYNKINRIGGRAAQAGFNKEDIESIEILRPEDSVIKLFEDHISVVFQQKLSNDKGSRKLYSIRDGLLQMIMNGQVSVD